MSVYSYYPCQIQTILQQGLDLAETNRPEYDPPNGFVWHPFISVKEDRKEDRKEPQVQQFTMTVEWVAKLEA